MSSSESHESGSSDCEEDNAMPSDANSSGDIKAECSIQPYQFEPTKTPSSSSSEDLLDEDEQSNSSVDESRLGNLEW